MWWFYVVASYLREIGHHICKSPCCLNAMSKEMLHSERFVLAFGWQSKAIMVPGTGASDCFVQVAVSVHIPTVFNWGSFGHLSHCSIDRTRPCCNIHTVQGIQCPWSFLTSTSIWVQQEISSCNDEAGIHNHFLEWWTLYYSHLDTLTRLSDMGFDICLVKIQGGQLWIPTHIPETSKHQVPVHQRTSAM